MSISESASRPKCRCHGETMDWTTDHWTCAVKRRRRQLAFYHRRKHDLVYMFDRQLRDMARIRVR